MTHFTSTLLSWFRDYGRDLPWRGTKDPYAIWLSEIILQQTQVIQGRDYWQRFIQRWPTVESLAAATEDEVLREWQGLGYYSRARNLHTAARQVVALGGFPTTLDGLRALKGVGDYTAAAIGSFAFGIAAAVVDGNVYRVLARYFGIDTPINTTQGKKTFAALAQEQMESLGSGTDSRECGSDYNQAIMDFGAIQCTPQSPRCEACPLALSCVAFRNRRVTELPIKLKTLKVRERHLTYVYVRCQGMTAIHRRGAGDIWQGLYEPWLLESCQPSEGQDTTCAVVPEGAVLLRHHVKHVLTHRVLYADFWLLETAQRPVLPADYIWIPEEQLGDYAVPRLVELLIEELWKKST